MVDKDKTGISVVGIAMGSRFLFILKRRENFISLSTDFTINLLGGKNVYVAGKYFDLDYNNGYSSMDEHYRCRDKLCMEINNDNTLLF